MQHLLSENERLDKVNDGITLIQRTDGLTFGTDALLLSAFVRAKNKKTVEFGSGTGIISLLLLQRKKASKVYAYEVQSDFALLTEKNAELNGYKDTLTVLPIDVRYASSIDTDGEADIIVTNPPYMKKGAGKNSSTDEKNIARREIYGGISDFCQAAKKILKYGGKFYCVYRPDRLSELFFSLKNASLEPKKLTLVYPHADSSPSLVLIEARHGGGEELRITRPLIIYSDTSHSNYTEDLEYIYENGNFPDTRF